MPCYEVSDPKRCGSFFSVALQCFVATSTQRLVGKCCTSSRWDEPAQTIAKLFSGLNTKLNGGPNNCFAAKTHAPAAKWEHFNKMAYP